MKLDKKNLNWKLITNKFKNTCCVCNRSIGIGEVIHWNKEYSLIQHLPEMCNLLGIRKKIVKRRKKAIKDSSQIYNFPVTVSYVK